MFQIDFNKPIYVHFIGIGGISMSGLAEILLSKGFRVSGSDMKESDLTHHLRALGAEVMIGQCAANIKNPDVVVYTAAIHKDNPELQEADRKRVPLLTRAEFLGELMLNYREAVNVAGTHGKTTTTSMLTQIMIEAGTDPTITVGGILSSIGGNIRVGHSDKFLAEACEYCNSFLDFYPTLSIVLNVEADHLDFFRDIDDIRHSFKEFIMRLPQDERGFLVINGDIHNVDYFLNDLKCGYVTFGKSRDYNYAAENITYDEKACPSYDLIVNGVNAGRVKLSVQGQHNVYNSLAAIAAADRMGIDRKPAIAALSHFTGTDRRFDYRGELNGFTVIDDYAHHPQEITATLKAAQMYPHNKLYVIFQPHTYTRTKALLNDFARALILCDEVIVADIYAARETDTLGISSEDLVKRINQIGGSGVYVGDFEKIKNYVCEKLAPGDLLITMGAGNVVDIADSLVGKKLSTI
ncbi:MAG: UDP-N-acetylmuramate--L-alanine ligase [Eubacteriales bacterium]|nr:UDP-N-acetylmuramate--L-alanine ligase [Eubacteriales bacterium]